MKQLSMSEMQLVAGGELSCTVSIPFGVSCTGTLSDWEDAFDKVVGAVTDAICAGTGDC